MAHTLYAQIVKLIKFCVVNKSPIIDEKSVCSSLTDSFAHFLFYW